MCSNRGSRTSSSCKRRGTGEWRAAIDHSEEKICTLLVSAASLKRMIQYQYIHVHTYINCKDVIEVMTPAEDLSVLSRRGYITSNVHKIFTICIECQQINYLCKNGSLLHTVSCCRCVRCT